MRFSLLSFVALLAAGQSGAITTTYTGQYVMDGFLNLQIPLALRAVITRLIAITPSILVCILVPDKLNSLVNVVNALLVSLISFAFSLVEATIQNDPGSIFLTGSPTCSVTGIPTALCFHPFGKVQLRRKGHGQRQGVERDREGNPIHLCAFGVVDQCCHLVNTWRWLLWRSYTRYGNVHWQSFVNTCAVGLANRLRMVELQNAV